MKAIELATKNIELVIGRSQVRLLIGAFRSFVLFPSLPVSLLNNTSFSKNLEVLKCASEVGF